MICQKFSAIVSRCSMLVKEIFFLVDETECRLGSLLKWSRSWCRRSQLQKRPEWRTRSSFFVKTFWIVSIISDLDHFTCKGNVIKTKETSLFVTFMSWTGIGSTAVSKLIFKELFLARVVNQLQLSCCRFVTLHVSTIDYYYLPNHHCSGKLSF